MYSFKLGSQCSALMVYPFSCVYKPCLEIIFIVSKVYVSYLISKKKWPFSPSVFQELYKLPSKKSNVRTGISLQF